MDERILNLHQKIKTQPVVIPEQYVLHLKLKANRMLAFIYIFT